NPHLSQPPIHPFCTRQQALERLPQGAHQAERDGYFQEGAEANDKHPVSREGQRVLERVGLSAGDQRPRRGGVSTGRISSCCNTDRCCRSACCSWECCTAACGTRGPCS